MAYGSLYTDSGLAFMTQNYTYLYLPLYGELEVASALAFDFGVYAVVVGALLTILSVVGAE
jgi:multicomponent Na+:H+ antiporter subunit B